jgi:hypothetical protein
MEVLMKPSRKIVVFQENTNGGAIGQPIDQIRHSVALMNPTRAAEISFANTAKVLLAELEIYDDSTKPSEHSPNQTAFIVVGNANGSGANIASRIKSVYPKSLIYMYSWSPPLTHYPIFDGYIKKTYAKPYIPPKPPPDQKIAEGSEDHHPESVHDLKIWGPELPIRPKLIAHHEDLAAVLCFVTPMTTHEDLIRCFRVISSEPPD